MLEIKEHEQMDYWEKERAIVVPILYDLGFVLDKEQPHMSGERHFIQAVTTASGKKLILLARRWGHQLADNKRVVIKMTRESAGALEIDHERACRSALKNIEFAYKIFFSPKELLYARSGGYTISVQEFIEQDTTFLERPTEEQFSFAIKAFKAQEGAHAVTYRHRKNIQKTCRSGNSAHLL